MALAKERPIPHEYDPCMMMIVSPQIPFSADDPSLSLCFEEKSVNGEDAQSVINFSSLFTSCDQSLLSFEHSHSPRLISTDFNCFQTASDGWLYSESTVTEDSFDESGTQQTKRPHGGEICTAQALKTSNATNKKPKLHKSSPSKDPQSIAAKNRRERISERLKILQELVPNGSKVDLVTMLEKAISYVKFLQLQVKVLATDEFWPVQGGKAPDISQVREAIDAILSSSQRDRSSSSQ